MKLSIITPVYNRADCIIRCMTSVAKQKGITEHWLVDDGSTDQTAQLIEKFMCDHSNEICFHRFAHNRGVNAARNYAIENCTGDFILFLDSDDELTDSAVCKINQVIENNPQFIHYMFAVDSREDYYKSNKLLQKDESILTYKDWIQQKAEGDFSHVMRRNMLLKYPFNEKLRIYEDVTFLKLYKYSQKQLFSHRVIAKIERGRLDSVSRNYQLANSESIGLQKYALSEIIYNLYNDYALYNPLKLSKMLDKYICLTLATEDYIEYDKIYSERRIRKFPFIIIRKLKFGKLLCFLIIVYSRIKNRTIE